MKEMEGFGSNTDKISLTWHLAWHGHCGLEGLSLCCMLCSMSAFGWEDGWDRLVVDMWMWMALQMSLGFTLVRL